MTLYLKYRPRRIEDLDLAVVREDLGKMLKNGNVPHALLFAGPKGTGKTSAARILAKSLNCTRNTKGELGEPCGKCEMCLAIDKGASVDVIEMDAASHRGIDDIRQLREAVKLAPANARVKVYIVDEAHMLTTEASNAFLKTLEEPPEHVVFILATTDPGKLIDTIRSRATLVKFDKANRGEILRQLGRVVKGEKLKVTDEVLDIVAEGAEGSFRDAVKLLEQLIAEDSLSEKGAEKLIGANEDKLTRVLELLGRSDIRELLKVTEDLIASGEDVGKFRERLLEKVRVGILSSSGLEIESEMKGFDINKLLYLAKVLLDAGAYEGISPVAQLPLELALVKYCNKYPSSDDTGKNGGEVNKDNVDKDHLSKGSNGQKKDVASSARVESSQKVSGGGGLDPMKSGDWEKVLGKLRKENTSLQALLRAARPSGFDGDILRVKVCYKFHKERLETDQYRGLLEGILSDIVEDRAGVRVVYELGDPPVKKVLEKESKVVLTDTGETDIIAAAKQIFEEVSE